MRVWLRMENKIFRKTILADRVKWGFDPEMVLHFYFHYKPFSGQTRKERDRERERRESYRSTDRTLTPVPPYISHHHRRPIHRRSHHPRPIAPHRDRITLDRSTQNRFHRHCRYPWPISSPSRRYPSPRPISPFPSIFDHSLFLPLLVWSNGGV